MFFILLPVLVTAIYLLVLAYFIFGWNKTKPFNEHIQSEIKVSVIVVFRNEASTIQNLLLSLLKQDYPLKCTELIFVDDNSDDKSAAIIQHTLSDRGVDFTIINVAGHGVAKKRALTEGISKASGDLIITTDADCTMGSQWISSIVSYHIVAGCHMIVGPVRLTGNSILQQLQSVEFSVLQKMTCGALYYSNPLMCNGANLAYSRKAYFDVFESQNKSDKPTGDDTYLMFALHKKGNYKIGYLKTSKALVSTEAADSFRNFFNQRLRWASKTFTYRSAFVSFSGSIIFLSNAIMPLLLFNTILNPAMLWIYILIFLVRFLGNFILARNAQPVLKNPNPFLAIILLEFIYPFYVIVIGFRSQFGSYQWKGRSWKV